MYLPVQCKYTRIVARGGGGGEGEQLFWARVKGMDPTPQIKRVYTQALGVCWTNI